MSDYLNILNKTGKRKESFTMMIEHIKGKENTLIVETGCVRMDGDYGAGMSTVLFDKYVGEFGGEFHSVDITPKNVELAKGLVKSNFTTIHCSDSVAFLNSFHKVSGRKIDLLYLDSMDYNPGQEHESSEHHLKELMAVLPYIQSGTMIAVDDNISDSKGKGAYILEYMNSHNKQRIHSGYQWIWIY